MRGPARGVNAAVITILPDNNYQVIHYTNFVSSSLNNNKYLII